MTSFLCFLFFVCPIFYCFFCISCCGIVCYAPVVRYPGDSSNELAKTWVLIIVFSPCEATPLCQTAFNYTSWHGWPHCLPPSCHSNSSALPTFFSRYGSVEHEGSGELVPLDLPFAPRTGFAALVGSSRRPRALEGILVRSLRGLLGVTCLAASFADS